MVEKRSAWIKAMIKWVEENRPDELDMFKQVFDLSVPNVTDGLILMAHIGFESGRQFQQENPDVPLGPIVEE